MKNIFKLEDSQDFINRITLLSYNSQPVWGKMNVSQMLAHCNVTYEMVYDSIHPKPNRFVKFLLKLFVKSNVVNEKPYPKNIRTAPQFIISDERDFEKEKTRLINYIIKTQELGKNEFEGKVSLSFGKLNSTEWNNMFAKHLDHHLKQFNV
ncbi:DUF1569 domain-containing protein [Flavobacterium procerum]|uniref:DUF1569 domain-containing protein n=1 Tax=Flavobacterium procerum TaxID=1455569 RepID=A0ABV6BZ09_9FLAO